MFENCLAVREVLQAYAPIVDGLPIHEGEAAMGRIEEQYAIAVDERDKAQEARRYLRGARDRLKEQLEAAREALEAALPFLPPMIYDDQENVDLTHPKSMALRVLNTGSSPARELISDLAETSETPIPAEKP